MPLRGKAQQPGFPTELGNRCRDSHIATAQTAATLFQNSKPERIILFAFPNPSGSSFDWKRLFDWMVVTLRLTCAHCAGWYFGHGGLWIQGLGESSYYLGFFFYRCVWICLLVGFVLPAARPGW